MRESMRPILFLLVFSAVLFSINIGGYDLWPADEPRFGQVGREILQSGDWLTLHVNGEPYMEKPPLLFWAMAIISYPFGDVSETTARIPSILFGIITVLLTYSLAKRLYGPRIALWSGVILITCLRFWWQARSAQTDMALTGCLTAALYAFWRWHEGRRTAWLMAFYGAVAAAVFAKGPPGVILPLLFAFTFYWRRREERRQMHLLWGVLAIAALISLWLIPAWHAASIERAASTQQTVASNLLRQTIGRLFLGVSHREWPWYYLIALPMDLFPWTLFLPWTLPWVWLRRKEDERMRFVLSWIIPAFILFTIAMDKRELYLLPLYPGFAILLARSVTDLVDSERIRWRKRTLFAWGVLLALLAAAPFALLATEYRDEWTSGLLIFSTFTAVLAADAFRRAKMTGGEGIHRLVAVHFAAMSILIALFVFPVVNEFKGARSFCTPLRRLSEKSVPYRLYSVGFTREAYVYYSKHSHEAVFTDVVPMELPEGMSPLKMALTQKRLREDIVKAVKKVSIADLGTVADAEMEALREAIRKTVLEDKKVDSQMAADFQWVLTKEVRSFSQAFEKPEPAFLFVKENDWRWFLVFGPELRHFPLVQADSVGSRDVLLVANDAGASLLAMQKETNVQP